MSGTKGNILVGAPKVSGGVRIAESGTELLKSATGAVPVAYKSAGYVSEEGLTETVGQETERIKAWGGDTVRVLTTEHSVQYQLTFLESKNGTVLEQIYGKENVEAFEGGFKITYRKHEADEMVWVFDMFDGEDNIRIVVPVGQVVETADVVYVHNDVLKYTVTVEAFPDETGAKAYKYQAKATAGAGG